MAQFTFRPNDYGEWCAKFLSSEIVPSLGPGSPDRQMDGPLAELSIEQLFRDAGISNRQMASCCLSGIWLLFDFLHESHQISQRISNSSGSFWHGIMHRREPDPSNAKYWFRKVGAHPIHDNLAVAATELVCQQPDLSMNDVLDAGSDWDAFRFVDLCERYRDTSTPQETLCRKIAQLEWQMLFDHCYHAAIA